MTDEKKKGGSVKKIIAAVAVLIIIGVVVLYMNMGSIAKTMAEKVGSETLGVKVSIGSIDINLKEKSVAVHSISIANPEGYSEPNAMTVELVNVDMDSFSKELLVFDDVTVKGAELFLEVNERGTNLSDLQNNLGNDRKDSTDNKESEGGCEAPKVILKNFLFSGAQLHPKVTFVGANMSDINVPDIKLTGIGEKENGVLAREAIAQIWSKISSASVNASASAGMLEGISAEGLKDLPASIKLPQDLSIDTDDALDKASEGLKGLFGK